jgi:hypothetical protein
LAAGDLTTVANLEAYVKIGATQEEVDFAARLITAASAYFRRRTQRDIQAPVATYTGENHSGDGNWRIHTREYPVTEVTSVAVDGATVAQAVNPGDQGWILTDAEAGAIELVGHLFEVGTANVSLTYKAGFAAIPADIEQAVIELVAWKFHERDRLGQTARTTDGMVVQFTTAAESIGVKQVIDCYRRRDP